MNYYFKDFKCLFCDSYVKPENDRVLSCYCLPGDLKISYCFNIKTLSSINIDDFKYYYCYDYRIDTEIMMIYKSTGYSYREFEIILDTFIEIFKNSDLLKNFLLLE